MDLLHTPIFSHKGPGPNFTSDKLSTPNRNNKSLRSKKKKRRISVLSNSKFNSSNNSNSRDSLGIEITNSSNSSSNSSKDSSFSQVSPIINNEQINYTDQTTPIRYYPDSHHVNLKHSNLFKKKLTPTKISQKHQTSHDSDDSGHNSHDSSRKNSNENTPNTSIGKLAPGILVDHEIVNSSPENDNENDNKNEETKHNLQNYYTPLKLEHNSLKRKSDASTPGFNCSANLEKSRLENSSLDLQFLIENKKTRLTKKSSVQIVDSPSSSNLPLSPENNNNDTQVKQNDQNYQNINPNKVKSNLCQSKFETSLLKTNNESNNRNHNSFPSFAPDVVSDFSKPIVEAEYFLKVNSWEDMLFFKHQDYQFEKRYEIEDKPVKSSFWGFEIFL